MHYAMYRYLIMSAVFISFECEQLHDYKFPVYTTEICPRNQTEWKKRSSALHCTDFKGYMCVPNEDFTSLLEFCYSSFKIAIQPGVCLFLTKKNSALDIYDCQRFTSGCPDFIHFTDQMYELSDRSCVSIGNGCFLAEPTCSFERSTSFIITTIVMSKNTIQTENMNHSNSPTRPSQVVQQQSTTKFNSAVTLSIILVVNGLSLICSSAIAFYLRKTKKYNPTCLPFVGKPVEGCGYKELSMADTNQL